MKHSVAYAVAIAALLLVGCDQGEPMAATPADQSAPAPAQVTPVAASASALRGRVAVFDIDQIADQTGMMQDMQAKILAKKEELTKELDGFRKKLQDQLEIEGKKLTKDKDLPKKAAALEQATSIKFRQGQAEADAALNNYRMQLIEEIREAIRPVAREVASAKGFDILMTRNDLILFDVSNEVELTGEILAAYQARFPNAVKKPEPAGATR